MQTVSGDMLEAVRAWPIWLRLGLQDVRSGFQRSALGVGWILVNFAATLVAVGAVYGVLLGQPVREFLPFLASGLLVWLYLTSSVVEGSAAFVASEGYIKQIGITPYVYVLRYFVSITFKMLSCLLCFAALAAVMRVRPGWGTAWAAPGLLLLCAVSLLLILIFAHLNARFRDASHAAALCLQTLFYVTPVLWPPEMLRGRALGWVVDFNPLHHLLEVVRQPLLHSRPASPANYQATALLLVGLALVASYLSRRYHRRLAYLF